MPERSHGIDFGIPTIDAESPTGLNLTRGIEPLRLRRRGPRRSRRSFWPSSRLILSSSDPLGI